MNIDLNSLPPEFQSKLLVLQNELAEGYITQKGFEKSRNDILQEYRQQLSSSFHDDQSYYEEFASTLPIQNLQISGLDSNEAASFDDSDYENEINQPQFSSSPNEFYSEQYYPRQSSSPIPPPPPDIYYNNAVSADFDRARAHNRNLSSDSANLRRNESQQLKPRDSTRIPPQNHAQINYGPSPSTQHHPMSQRPPPPHIYQSTLYPNNGNNGVGPKIINNHPFGPPIRPTIHPSRPQRQPSIRPPSENTNIIRTPSSYIPNTDIINRTKPVYENQFDRTLSLTAGRNHVADDNGSIKDFTRINDEFGRFADDNTSIRSNRSTFIDFQNGNSNKFDTMIGPDDRPIGRNAGDRMSFYNNKIYSGILDALPNHDPELVKLAGLQFMPFEQRELHFENIDPLNPLQSLSVFTDIASILRYRGQSTPNQTAYIVVDSKGREVGDMTWKKLHLRAEKLAQIITREGGLMKGDRVALIYRKTEILEFLVAMFGCFFAGVVAVPINTVDDFKELLFILESTNTKLALTTEQVHKVFTRDLQAQKKELPASVLWWKTDNFGMLSLKKNEELNEINLADLAYIEYTKSPNSELKGVAISHRTIISQCSVMRGSVVDNIIRDQLIDKRQMQQQNPLGVSYDSNALGMGKYGPLYDIVLSYLEPRQQVGILLTAFWGVYCGNITIFLASTGPDVPGLWTNCLSKYKVTIALADYPGLMPMVKSFKTDPSATINYNKKQPLDLRALRFLFIDTLVINVEKNDDIIENFLSKLGVKNPADVLTPLSSLPEHGGMVLCFGDLLGVPGLDDRNEGERGVVEFLLDREELKSNKIMVVGMGEEQCRKRSGDKTLMRVGAFGFVMPEATIAIVDPETTAFCLPNTVGELWVDSSSLSGGFWNLPKHTESIFHARPIFVSSETGIPEYFEQEFLRTGLLGALINGQLVIFGLYEQRIRQLVEPVPEDSVKVLRVVNPNVNKWKFHYTPDLENTVLNNIDAISDCVVIEIYANEQTLPVLLGESLYSLDKLPKVSDDVYNILLENHGVKIYCIGICQQGSLPRTWKNGKHLVNPLYCKKFYEHGKLNFTYIKTNVHETVYNLPVGEDTMAGIWGPNAMAARQEQLNSSASPIIKRPQITGIEHTEEVLDERTGLNLLKFRSIIDVLLWRTLISPDETSYNVLDNKGKEGKPISWKKLNIKIATIANYLQKKGPKANDTVILIYPHGIDFVCAVYACMVLGIVSIPIPQIEISRLSEDIPALFGIIDEFKVSNILVNTDTENILKSKTVQNFLKTMSTTPNSSTSSTNNRDSVGMNFTSNGKLPVLINTTKAPKYTKTLKESNYLLQEEWINPNHTAVIMCYFSSDHGKSCVRLNHQNLLALCKVQKETCRLTTTRAIVSSVRSTCGIGFVHTLLIGVYLGSPTIIITPNDYSENPLIWFETLSKFKIKDTYATFPMLQHAMKIFETVDYKSFSLQHLKNLMIPIDTRPNANLYKKIVRTFLTNRLDDVSVNYIYSHVSNPMITTRSYMCVEPIELYLDLKSLRRGIVRVVNPADEPYGVLLHDSGMVPVSTQVAIVHPETRRPCLSNEFGEIWVSSDANAKSALLNNDPLEHERYNAVIDGGDQRLKYLRTGDLGFLYTVHRPVGEGGALVEFQCLFFLGPIAETIEVNGLMHFPVDVEFTVERCHQLVNPSLIVPDGCVIFQANDETICAVEVRSVDGLLNLIPCIINSILDEHRFIIDVVAFVSSNNMPRSRLGEKQRAKVRAAWWTGNLATLHIHHVKPYTTSTNNPRRNYGILLLVKHKRVDKTQSIEL
ncbi:6022_t:CDS:10 [Entrophospora sp. SA101]|nr:6022_t:CDS:10 [Entrophospora sp. SA101]